MEEKQTGQQEVTRLGTPAAFLMLAGLLLVYYALRGWDAKYNTFGGTFAGSPTTADAVTTSLQSTPLPTLGTPA